MIFQSGSKWRTDWWLPRAMAKEIQHCINSTHNHIYDAHFCVIPFQTLPFKPSLNSRLHEWTLLNGKPFTNTLRNCWPFVCLCLCVSICVSCQVQARIPEVYTVAVACWIWTKQRPVWVEWINSLPHILWDSSLLKNKQLISNTPLLRGDQILVEWHF